MEKYHALLKQLEQKQSAKLLRKHKLVCKQLPYGNEAPLYVAKNHWTNRFDDDRDKTIGLFYSIWVSEKSLAKGQFSYNLHAKTLNKLPGYKLTPRKFADEFRLAIKKQVTKWPGISLDHGPTTLFQGHDTCDSSTFAAKIDERLNDFVSIHQEIDKLLDAAAT